MGDSRKDGTREGDKYRLNSTWQLLCLASERPWLALGRPFLFLICTNGPDNASLTL